MSRICPKSSRSRSSAASHVIDTKSPDDYSSSFRVHSRFLYHIGLGESKCIQNYLGQTKRFGGIGEALGIEVEAFGEADKSEAFNRIHMGGVDLRGRPLIMLPVKANTRVASNHRDQLLRMTQNAFV